MYEYLRNPKHMGYVIDVALCLQIGIYAALAALLYHVKDLDPTVSTSWESNLATLCLIFVVLGALNILLLVLCFSQVEQKKSIMPVHRIILVVIVLGLILSGHSFVAWTSSHSAAYDGGWPFIQL